jgi:DNA adenine methylase
LKTIVPPIKSQGIKTKLVPWIMDVAKKANSTGRWIEPFLGTGVVAFNSGFKDALLNDTNPHVIKFYKGIQDGTITPAIVKRYLQEEGEKLSKAGDNGYAYFLEVRERFNKEFAPLDLLFLSRTGFNGMMRFGSKGNWNIPFCKKPNRFSQSYITKIVNQVAKVKAAMKDGWAFTNKTFAEIIPLANKDDLVYCDPPYFGRYVDYYNGWTEQDEERMFHLLNETSAKFILSTWHHNDYRENEMVKKFWNNFNVVTKDHFYHGGGKIENRNSMVEALVFNFDADVEKHNHDKKLRPKVEQIPMFEIPKEEVLHTA